MAEDLLMTVIEKARFSLEMNPDQINMKNLIINMIATILHFANYSNYNLIFKCNTGDFKCQQHMELGFFAEKSIFNEYRDFLVHIYTKNTG